MSERESGGIEPPKKYPDVLAKAPDKGFFDAGVNFASQYYRDIADGKDIFTIIVDRGYWRGSAKYLAKKYPQGDAQTVDQVALWEDQIRQAAFERGEISEIDIDLYNTRREEIEKTLEMDQVQKIIELTADKQSAYLKSYKEEHVKIAKEFIKENIRELAANGLVFTSLGLALTKEWSAAWYTLAASSSLDSYPQVKARTKELFRRKRNKGKTN